MPPSWLAATKKCTFAVAPAVACPWTSSLTLRIPATPAYVRSTNHTEPTWSPWISRTSAEPRRSLARPSRNSWPIRWSSDIPARTRSAHAMAALAVGDAAVVLALAVGDGVLPEGELAVTPGLPQAVSITTITRMRARVSLARVRCHSWWNAGWLIFVTWSRRDRRYSLSHSLRIAVATMSRGA